MHKNRAILPDAHCLDSFEPLCNCEGDTKWRHVRLCAGLGSRSRLCVSNMDEDLKLQTVPTGAVAVVIVAAGRGERAAQTRQRAQAVPRDRWTYSVLYRTIEAFASHPAIGRICVSIHSGRRCAVSRRGIGTWRQGAARVFGGATRQNRPARPPGISQREAPATVLVHDAVRPLVDGSLIDRIARCDRRRSRGAARVAGIGYAEARGGRRYDPGDSAARRSSRRADTSGLSIRHHPRRATRRPLAAGRIDFTDDAAIAEWAGLAVRIVAGSPDNIKLTWAKDIAMAHERLSRTTDFPDVRTGNGYDVHSFEPGEQRHALRNTDPAWKAAGRAFGCRRGLSCV